MTAHFLSQTSLQLQCRHPSGYESCNLDAACLSFTAHGQSPNTKPMNFPTCMHRSYPESSIPEGHQLQCWLMRRQISASNLSSICRRSAVLSDCAQKARLLGYASQGMISHAAGPTCARPRLLMPGRLKVKSSGKRLPPVTGLPRANSPTAPTSTVCQGLMLPMSRPISFLPADRCQHGCVTAVSRSPCDIVSQQCLPTRGQVLVT